MDSQVFRLRSKNDRAAGGRVQACGRCPLKDVPECRHVPAEVWKRFKVLRVAHTYRPGNVLFYQGNRPLGLFFICNGRVKIIKEDRRGRCQIVRIVQAPDFLGDRAFFADRTYACSAESMEESRVCFLESRHYTRLFGQDLRMFQLLTRRFARELGRAEDNMHCLSNCGVEARFATRLLAQASRPGPNGGFNAELILPESRTELAQVLGTTIEAISRAFAKFCSKGLISVEGRRVRILQEARLTQAACPHHGADRADRSFDKNQIPL